MTLLALCKHSTRRWRVEAMCPQANSGCWSCGTDLFCAAPRWSPTYPAQGRVCDRATRKQMGIGAVLPSQITRTTLAQRFSDAYTKVRHSSAIQRSVSIGFTICPFLLERHHLYGSPADSPSSYHTFRYRSRTCNGHESNFGFGTSDYWPHVVLPSVHRDRRSAHAATGWKGPAAAMPTKLSCSLTQSRRHTDP